MTNQKFIIVWVAFILIFILGCNSDDKPTGRAVTPEEIIYEELPQTEELSDNTTNETQEIVEVLAVRINESEEELNRTLALEEGEKPEEFKFPGTSIVSTHNNVSLSIDNIKHEIKSEYWGKIIEITATVLNKGSTAFKPKLIVLLYDEKDFKEEWFKPKAEIDFDIEKLNPGEHITRQAIVSIAFDDIALVKNFKLILVDASDTANKPIVVAEKEFKAI